MVELNTIVSPSSDLYVTERHPTLETACPGLPLECCEILLFNQVPADRFRCIGSGRRIFTLY